MAKNEQPLPEPPDPEKSSGFQNIMRMIILIAGLAGAWFLLEWLMGGK
jgi:hypothetical protein